MTAVTECGSLVRYLAGREPTPYVVMCYQRSLAAIANEPVARIDRVLLAAARLGPLSARVADGYGRLFRATGGYRRRVTLALAILENAPDFHRQVNDGPEGSPAVVIAKLSGQLVASAAAMAVGIALFGPVHLITSAIGQRDA